CAAGGEVRVVRRAGLRQSDSPEAEQREQCDNRRGVTRHSDLPLSSMPATRIVARQVPWGRIVRNSIVVRRPLRARLSHDGTPWRQAVRRTANSSSMRVADALSAETSSTCVGSGGPFAPCATPFLTSETPGRGLAISEVKGEPPNYTFTNMGPRNPVDR